MIAAYTICSANYLPFAKAVGDSLLRHNPDHRFYIFLLDRYPAINSSSFAPHTLVHAAEMQVPELHAMNARYNIFELSCAFKPFAAEWLLDREPGIQELFYFDSDMLVFGRMTAAEEFLQDHSILLSPHLTTAKEFGARIYLEKDLVRAGVYNAGFFGLKNDAVVRSFLTWWKKRLETLCYNDTANGLFVDQLWLGFVPLNFPAVGVLFDPGYNVAYWNIEEREITESGGNFLVNGKYPLVFFHFSGFDVRAADNVLSRFYKHFTFETHPALKPLFDAYRTAVIANDAENFSALKPLMGTIHLKTKKRSFLKKTFYKIIGKK